MLSPINVVVTFLLSLLLCTGCSTARYPRSAPDWFPRLTSPTSSVEFDQTLFNQLTGNKTVPTELWQDIVDIDGDGREDAVITLETEEASGLRWRSGSWTTFILKGEQNVDEVFDLERSNLWFSLSTMSHLDHVVYGDEEIRRQFRVYREGLTWKVQMRDLRYANEGGDASSRGMRLRETREESVAVEKILSVKALEPGF